MYELEGFTRDEKGLQGTVYAASSSSEGSALQGAELRRVAKRSQASRPPVCPHHAPLQLVLGSAQLFCNGLIRTCAAGLNCVTLITCVSRSMSMCWLRFRI